MCAASVLTKTILMLSKETVLLTMFGNSTINEFTIYFAYNVEKCDASVIVRVGTRTLGFV